VGASVGATPLVDKAYLKRRRGKNRSGFRWYVRINVPNDLREILCKRTIERALNTSDHKEAQRLKHAVLAEIFEDFERAKRRMLTSADIEHEAQRYLRDWLESIQKRPGTIFETATDSDGDDLGPGGDGILWTLQEALDEENWPDNIEREAGEIVRRYGATLTDAQRTELHRTLLVAQIEALSRTLSIHKGQVPEPLSVLNARAVDPFTATVQPRAQLAPKQGKAIRVSEAAKAYIADRNRDRSTAWTGQTLNQAQTRPCAYLRSLHAMPPLTRSRGPTWRRRVFLLGCGRLKNRWSTSG
jgi:hypothetical protein